MFSNSREYRTIRALRNHEIVDLGGIKFKMDVDESGEEKEIQTGDLYIAERNTGPKFLTAGKIVKSEEPPYGGYIYPTNWPADYPYDIGESVKVVEAE